MKLLFTLLTISFSLLFTDSSYTGEKPKDIQRTILHDFDLQQNRVSNVEFTVSNFGVFGIDTSFRKPGLIWPRGSDNAYMFASGFWFGAKKYNKDSARYLEYVTISYNPNNGRSWMEPGNIEDGDSLLLNGFYKYRTYFSTDFDKTNGQTINASEGPNWPLWKRNATLFPYINADADFEKDSLKRNLNNHPLGPNFFSDEDVFCSYKDTDLGQYDDGNHTKKAYGYPLRLQVNQRVLSWTKGKPLSDDVIIIYEIQNQSKDTLKDCYFAGIFDMDILPKNSKIGADNDKLRYYSEDPSLNLFVGWTMTDSVESGKEFGYIGISFLETPAVDQNRYILHSDGLINPENQIGASSYRNTTVFVDPYTEQERYSFISKRIYDGENEAYDVRGSLMTGSFNFLPGERTRFSVLITFAKPAIKQDADGTTEDLKDLIAKVKFARKYYYDPSTSRIDENQSNNHEFNILPNPATDFIEIQNHQNKSIEIMNVLGERVNLIPGLSTSGEEKRIDISSLAPGVYFLRIGDKCCKFVKCNN